MALGIVSDSEFESELSRMNGTKIKVEVEEISRGRGENNLEVPESLRTIIGTDAIENGNNSAKEIARAFQISDSSVSAYKNGSTSCSSYDNPNPSLKNKMDETRVKIGNKARATLLKSIKHITDEKLEGAKLKDLATVASAMSAVIKNIEPVQEDKGNQTNFVFYAPRFRDEASYDIIEVKE